QKTFGIFDGMGGRSGGSIASQFARNYIEGHLSELPGGVDIDTAKNALLKIMVESDKALWKMAEGSEEHSGMGTTAVIVKIHTDPEGKNSAIIGNVGDSRVYKIGKDGVLKQITLDDDILSRYFREKPE